MALTFSQPLTDFPDVHLRQFRARIGFPARMILAPFCNHILNVLSLSAQEKMCRVYASRVIAFMKHPEGAW